MLPGLDKVYPGRYVCDVTKKDSDSDGILAYTDGHTYVHNESILGICGVFDFDSNDDDFHDCIYQCFYDKNMTEAGGYSKLDADRNHDEASNCHASYTDDPRKTYLELY